MNVCMTGHGRKVRDRYVEDIRQAGWYVHDSVRKTTDLLVASSAAQYAHTTKVKDAQTFGVEIIDYYEFETRLQAAKETRYRGTPCTGCGRRDHNGRVRLIERVAGQFCDICHYPRLQRRNQEEAEAAKRPCAFCQTRTAPDALISYDERPGQKFCPSCATHRIGPVVRAEREAARLARQVSCGHCQTKLDPERGYTTPQRPQQVFCYGCFYGPFAVLLREEQEAERVAREEAEKRARGWVPSGIALVRRRVLDIV